MRKKNVVIISGRKVRTPSWVDKSKIRISHIRIKSNKDRSSNTPVSIRDVARENPDLIVAQSNCGHVHTNYGNLQECIVEPNQAMTALKKIKKITDKVVF